MADFRRPGWSPDWGPVFLLACLMLVTSLWMQQTARASEVWEVSTRHLTCDFNAADAGDPRFEVFRSEACGVWYSSSMEELIGGGRVGTSGPGAIAEPLTIVYTHGNWMTRENARSRAHFIANHMECQGGPAFRLIMLSWPSQRERKPVRDILENTECTDTQSIYLGILLRRLGGSQQMSLFGFSLGGRVTTGALHLYEGGCLNGRYLECAQPLQPDRRFRLSLAAPAVDRTWLTPQGRHGLATTHVERIVNLYNSRDPVLRRFRFVDALTRPIAAGYAGLDNAGDPRSTAPLVGMDRLVQYDCSSTLGKTHDERSYFQKCPSFTLAIANLFWKIP
jgi:pimeloyl-ACP methyl ester carboxylesterase